MPLPLAPGANAAAKAVKGNHSHKVHLPGHKHTKSKEEPKTADIMPGLQVRPSLTREESTNSIRTIGGPHNPIGSFKGDPVSTAAQSHAKRKQYEHKHAFEITPFRREALAFGQDSRTASEGQGSRRFPPRSRYIQHLAAKCKGVDYIKGLSRLQPRPRNGLLQIMFSVLRYHPILKMEPRAGYLSCQRKTSHFQSCGATLMRSIPIQTASNAVWQL